MSSEQLLNSGLSLSTIEDMTIERYEHNYKESKKMFMENIRVDAKPFHRDALELEKGTDWPYPVNLISSAIFSKFAREEKTFNRLFSSLTAEWIACDHTYKSVANIGYFRSTDGKWTKQYKRYFIITNEKGQSVQCKFTKTDQFEEVRKTFSQLSERLQR